MGEQVNIEKCWISVDGESAVEWHGIQTVESEIDNQLMIGEQVDRGLAAGIIDCSFTLKWPKYFRCKNRKRFIKLLMSTGLDRNTAVIFADTMSIMNEFVGFKHSYQEWWWHYIWSHLARKETKR